MKIKVFHFIMDHRVGGPHVYVLTLNRLLRDEVDSTLITTGRGAVTGLALVNLRHFWRWLYPIEIILNSLMICWIFRRSRVREKCIFDIHGAGNIAPIVSAKLLGIPVVWHFHETIDSMSRLVHIGRWVLQDAVCRNVVVARSAARIYGLAEHTIIAGAVDAEKWRLTESERAARNVLRPFRFMAVANLNPLKGLDLLLEALLRFDHPCEVMVAGAELSTYHAYADGLKEKSRMLASSGKRIEFLGWQSAEEVRSLLATADVFVLPSRSEACPIALLEAMSMECVCVATDVGDVRYILSESETGIVVNNSSPEALRNGLELAFDLNQEARQIIGARARAQVLRNYSPDDMASRHLNIYKALVH